MSEKTDKAVKTGKSEVELIADAAAFGLNEAFVRQLLEQFGTWAVEFIIAFLKERGIVSGASHEDCTHGCCKAAAESIVLCLDGDHCGSCHKLAEAMAQCCRLCESDA